MLLKKLYHPHCVLKKGGMVRIVQVCMNSLWVGKERKREYPSSCKRDYYMAAKFEVYCAHSSVKDMLPLSATLCFKVHISSGCQAKSGLADLD